MKLKAPDGKVVVDPYTRLPVEGVVDTSMLTTAQQISLLRLHMNGDLVEVIDPPPPPASKKAASTGGND